ncbi:hypothetical protein Mapa_002298 [Marchantia paleacea]|nr:hypothetical protein Mapa_002298 [Marchantia paleacea]
MSSDPNSSTSNLLLSDSFLSEPPPLPFSFSPNTLRLGISPLLSFSEESESRMDFLTLFFRPESSIIDGSSWPSTPTRPSLTRESSTELARISVFFVVVGGSSTLSSPRVSIGSSSFSFVLVLVETFSSLLLLVLSFFFFFLKGLLGVSNSILSWIRSKAPESSSTKSASRSLPFSNCCSTVSPCIIFSFIPRVSTRALTSSSLFPKASLIRLSGTACTMVEFRPVPAPSGPAHSRKCSAKTEVLSLSPSFDPVANPLLANSIPAKFSMLSGSSNSRAFATDVSSFTFVFFFFLLFSIGLFLGDCIGSDSASSSSAIASLVSCTAA